MTQCCNDYNDTSTFTNFSTGQHYEKMCNFSGQMNGFQCRNNTTALGTQRSAYNGQDSFDTTALHIVVALVSPIGILANLLILIALQKAVRARNSATLFYIRNLAVADLLNITGLILLLMTYNSNVVNGLPYNCRRFLFSSFDIFVGSASLLHITAVSMDRAFAVLYPIKHLSRATKSRATKTVIGLWVFSLQLLVLALLRIIIVEKSYVDFVYFYAVVLTFFIPCFLVINAYVAIIVTVIKTNFQLIRSNIRASSAATVQTSRYREIKLAFNVIIIIIPYVCGWGYFMILTMYEQAHDVVFTGLLDWFTVALPFLVSCINPLIYLLCTASLKKYSIRLLRKWCKCKLFSPSDFLKTSFRSSRGGGDSTTVIRASTDGNELDIGGNSIGDERKTDRLLQTTKQECIQLQFTAL